MDTWSGDFERPATLNKFLYADCDPILYFDPTGQFSLTITLGFLAIGFLFTIGTCGCSNQSGLSDKQTSDDFWAGAIGGAKSKKLPTFLLEWARAKPIGVRQAIEPQFVPGYYWYLGMSDTEFRRLSRVGRSLRENPKYTVTDRDQIGSYGVIYEEAFHARVYLEKEASLLQRFDSQTHYTSGRRRFMAEEAGSSIINLTIMRLEKGHPPYTYQEALDSKFRFMLTPGHNKQSGESFYKDPTADEVVTKEFYHYMVNYATK